MSRFSIVLALGLLTACTEDVGKGKVAATVADVPSEQAAAPAEVPADAVALAVDTSKSKLSALGAKITAKHPIDFREYTGEVKVAGDQVVGISYTAKIASLKSDSERLDQHLLDEDFFFAEKYPEATFVSTEVEAGSDAEGMTHTVTGDLTIRGKTKRVTFPAKIDVGEGEVKASTEFVVDRQDFGVTYPGKPDDLVQDNVVLTIEFVAPRS